MGMYENQRCLVFDESGNLGSSGRYFVIGCVDTQNAKELHNIMKRKLGKAKICFPKLATLHAHEIKAKEAYPCIKEHILKSIVSKNLSISFIVLDLMHIKPSLLEDKNIMYNYASKLLISKLITKNDEGTTVNIIFDNKTNKIASANSLKDYIRIHLNYEEDLDIKIHFEYKDSDAGDAYIIQAADYVANALYNYYEYNNSQYFSILKSKLNVIQKFPYKEFGM